MEQFVLRGNGETCEILGSHSGEDVSVVLLGCDVMWSNR
jgi:hypothetical protein